VPTDAIFLIKVVWAESDGRSGAVVMANIRLVDAYDRKHEDLNASSVTHACMHSWIPVYRSGINFAVFVSSGHWYCEKE
jgi:hypothetical protein